MGIKLVVIGGASSYTPELFANIANHPGSLDIEQVTLVDLNAEKLEFIAHVCRRLIEVHALKVRLATTTNLDEGLLGADFILPQIRIGGLEARVRDETLPMELGMVGNETTGAGGFVCAMRVLPVMLDIAHKIEKISPHAWILNLTNPAGIVTEAINKQTNVENPWVLQYPDQYNLRAGRCAGCGSFINSARFLRAQSLELDTPGDC